MRTLDDVVAEAVVAERERIIAILASEDIAGDPTDLYTGRAHRIVAIRAGSGCAYFSAAGVAKISGAGGINA